MTLTEHRMIVHHGHDYVLMTEEMEFPEICCLSHRAYLAKVSVDIGVKGLLSFFLILWFSQVEFLR